jgi:hypothetical protein
MKALPADEKALVLSSSTDRTLITGQFGGDEEKDHLRYFEHSLKDYTRKLDEGLLRPHKDENQVLHQVMAVPAR